MRAVKTVEIAVTWEQYAWLLQHDTKSKLRALSLVMLTWKKEGIRKAVAEHE